MSSTDSVIHSLFEQPVHRRVLDNGLIVLVKEDRSSQISSVQLWIKTGSIHEGALLGAGLSHYLEHMLFKGTEMRTGKQISREVQSLGGYINAYTTFDRTVYYIDLPSENTRNAIDILSDAVFNSTLPEDEVERERDVILREIDMGLDDPDHRLGRTLFETCYREHPYKYPIIGYRDIFETVTRDELTDYFKRRYVPNNMVLVIAGDVSAESIFKFAEEITSSVSRKRLENIYIPEEPPALTSREQVLTGDVNISRLGLAFTIPGLCHEDSAGLSLMAGVLGNGHSSILWQCLREDLELVHHVDVSIWNPGSSGLFWVSMIADPNKKADAIDALWGEIESLKSTLVEDALLEKARQQAMVAEVNSRKTMSGQASRLGAAEVVVGDLGYPQWILEQIRDVSSEDLRRLIRHYLCKERLTQVSLDPEAREVENNGNRRLEQSVHEFRETKFDNGARLLMQDSTDFPKVHLRLIFQGGAIWEPADQRGITALGSTLLTKDTTNRTAAEVATAIETLGGFFAEFSGNNTFGLSLEVLPQDLGKAVDLLEESLFNLKPEEATFLRERDGQIAHIKESMDEIVDYGIRELRKLYFGDVPYSVNSYGNIEDLESIDLTDVGNFLDSQIQAENCVLSVCGSFDSGSLESRLSEIMKNLPSGSWSARTVDFEKPAATGKKVVHLDRQQAVVFQAFPSVGVRQEALMIVASVLDEMFSGMSSHLFERVRDEMGLAYFVGSSRVIGLDAGMIYLYGGTHPYSCESVLEEMDREVQRIGSGNVQEGELDRIKVRLKAQRRMSLQTIGSRAMQAGLNATYGLPINDWIKFDALVDGVSVDDLVEFVGTYLTAEKRFELVVTPDG